MWGRNEIINRILSRLGNDTQKLQGSFSYDNAGAVANELEMLYETKIKDILDKAFLDTTTGNELTFAAKDKGIIRKPATYAKGQIVLTGAVGAVIPKDTQVSNNRVIYTTVNDIVIDESGRAYADIICMQSGEAGNTAKNTIKYLPISVSGLHDVYNEKAVTGGYEAERDDDLRQRVYMFIREPASSGNKYDYRQWALGVEGVSSVKVIPTWIGAGTVKIIVIDTNGQPADAELLERVHNHIEEKRPVGAEVTVCGAEPLPINISCELILDGSSELVIAKIEQKLALSLKSYFANIAFENNAEVSYAKISYEILSCEGVNDVINLRMNDVRENIPLGDRVPVLGNMMLRRYSIND